MPRRHLFVLVVLLGAVAVAGLLAVTRTVAAGSSTTSSPTSAQEAAISFRLHRLDRLEASLRKKLAAQGATAPAPVTVYRRSPTPLPTGSSAEAHEHESADDDGAGAFFEEGRDD
jgi:hypothetical protein